MRQSSPEAQTHGNNGCSMGGTHVPNTTIMKTTLKGQFCFNCEVGWKSQGYGVWRARLENNSGHGCSVDNLVTSKRRKVWTRFVSQTLIPGKYQKQIPDFSRLHRNPE